MKYTTTTPSGICLSANAWFLVFHYLLLHNTPFSLLLLVPYLFFFPPSSHPKTSIPPLCSVQLSLFFPPKHPLFFHSPLSFYQFHCSWFSKYVTILNHHHDKWWCPFFHMSHVAFNFRKPSPTLGNQMLSRVINKCVKNFDPKRVYNFITFFFYILNHYSQY